MKPLLFIILSLVLPQIVLARLVSGTVTDTADGQPLPGCSVVAHPGNTAVVTDADGRYSIKLGDTAYKLTISYVGYDSVTVAVSAGRENVQRDIKLQESQNILREVTVTAHESTGATSASRIDRSAMQHLQPTSFSDLLELLPGNMSQTPSMGKANTIALRETGNVGANGEVSQNQNYSMSSLGTLYMVDGAPVTGDANLQTVGTTSDATSPAYGRDITNRGVDMRSIATDNIESVEIVRGIPSAEYGNLTSGLVNIKRIKRATPFTARFKADQFSKLFSIGKGFSFSNSRHVANFDAGYLDSKTDPRNSLDNYKRVNASARATFDFTSPQVLTTLKIGADYTGSFDNTKVDPDLTLSKIDEYSSKFNRYGVSAGADFTMPFGRIFNSAAITTSLSYENDRLTRRKQVAPSRATVAPTSMAEGVHDGRFILGEYIADYLSDGKPMTVFAKGRISGKKTTGAVSNEYKAGVEWNMSKNYGRGQVYDLSRPLSASWTSRPRAYRDIPALHVVSAFIEDAFNAQIGTNKLDLQLGARSIQLAHLDKAYTLSGKMYIDPRVNAVWHFPAVMAGRRPLELLLAAGWGLTTKMPTIDYLYPQAHYNDFVQLSYYDVNDPVNLSRINLRTYIDDATNYDLRAARNRKAELRIGAQYGGNSLSVTYFDERLRSGYRYSTIYAPYSYRYYDASAVDASTLTAPPALEGLPYTDRKVLDGYRLATNGSRIDKRGLEFQISTARWKPLCTALTVSGAWLHTTYSNSQMLFTTVNDVVDSKPVSNSYVGLYNDNDGRVNDQFNTNFMFDTQIPRWGLIFTTSVQCRWWLKTRTMWRSGVPVAYLSAEDGQLHPYTAESAADPVLRFLTRNYNEAQFATINIPVATFVNLKITKKIGRWMSVSMFVNNLIDWLPDYESNGVTVRRSADSYFGMEINLTL